MNYLFFPCSILLLSIFTISHADTFDNELASLLEGFDTNQAAMTDEEDEEDAELEALLNEFEKTTTLESDVASSFQATQKRKWDLVSHGSFSGSYNFQQDEPVENETDYRLSRLKYKLIPEFKLEISNSWNTFISANIFYDYAYFINGEKNYRQEVIDTYQSEIEFREAYIQGTITNYLDIKVGRQIVVWGKSDSIRVVDVLNPLDFREPGMMDIEDLRLPVGMIKTDFYYANWNLSAIVIPEIRFNKTPPLGSDFYLGQGDPIAENIPNSIVNPEFAVSLNSTFSGWDLSFHAAQVYDDIPYVKMNNSTPATLNHSRINLAGGATNFVLGNWLFKSETAIIDGLAFSNSNNLLRRLDVMFGFDYTGIQDIVYSVEAVNRRLLNYNIALEELPDLTLRDEEQIALRYTGNFFREKLQLVALLSIFGTSIDDGAFYRGSAEYEIFDAFSIMVGGIVYQAQKNNANSIPSKIAKNDRVFFDLRYSF